MNNQISIIIPTYNSRNLLEKLFESILNQSLQPDEVVIVDSSTNTEVRQLVLEFEKLLPLVYKFSKRKYPGEKINEGVKLAKFKWVAFLDAGTLPKKNWLEYIANKVMNENYDVVFGSTKYVAYNTFNRILRSATYGKVSHETVPGTIISKNNFISTGGFVENIRSGQDMHWRLHVKESDLKFFFPKDFLLEYINLPNSIFSMQKKYFEYYYHSSKLSTQYKNRERYLSLLLILSLVIVTKWNLLLENWDENPLFIPHLTKIYFISILIFIIFYTLLKKIFLNLKRFLIFNFTINLVVIGVLTFVIFRWNYRIADWVETSIFYIPHITKIYVFLIFLFSYFYRGIYLPLKLKIKFGYLFPFRWMMIGLIGLSFDIAKLPGVIMGIILAPFYRK